MTKISRLLGLSMRVIFGNGILFWTTLYTLYVFCMYIVNPRYIYIKLAAGEWRRYGGSGSSMCRIPQQLVKVGDTFAVYMWAYSRYLVIESSDEIIPFH